ncbi:ferritin-like domain-containing protein [Paenibacillus abyssi]|uniref:Rubrerythrin diiron-binding domain-containing protein n=1 Tax=Paenibacillus abyssi TaxID=1340531 RepID=A0A917D409_9BACL|nr:ferritin-like domain-containing protein [Paenibacillus abyssi]GGG09109.1 hypothetical protein GCM10010916_27430 [Paenibacillus abyssi]
MFYSYDYVRTSTDIGLINDVAQAINGEFAALTCYEQLAKITANDEIRKQILEIRHDEFRHYQAFSQIYIYLTGKQPTPQLLEQCPTDYWAGLHAAFKDEQKTSDFYREVADKTQDPYIKEQFLRAAADEQNHAVWFLYFLTQHEKKH